MTSKTHKKNKKNNYQNKISKILKEKYSDLLIGLTVVLIALVLFNLKYSNKKNNSNKTQSSKKEKVANQPKYYQVKKGDNLWKIAEENYGSGYNENDIIKANKLTNPDILFVGQKIVLPKVAPKKPTIGTVLTKQTKKVANTSNSYKVLKGDSLWKIALKSYGDGYAWVKIAKANKLANPNIIYQGRVLRIPR